MAVLFIARQILTSYIDFLDSLVKKEMDVLMRKWTKGKLGGKELDRLIKEFLQKKDCPVRKITMLEKAVCVFPSEKELPDYTKTLAKICLCICVIYRGTAG